MHVGGEMIDVHGRKSNDVHGSQRERKQRVAGGHRRKAAREMRVRASGPVVATSQ
jgi:hypothetical protein